MEAAAGVAGRRGSFCPAAAQGGLRREAKAVAGWAASRRVSVRPRGIAGGYADDGHLRYYAQPARCGGGRREEKEAMKRRADLMKGLTALQDMGGLGVVAGRVGMEEGKMTMMEAADALLARLELLRAEEKEMKRKKKEEKAAMRATAKQMKACDESEGSEEEQDDNKEEDSMMMMMKRKKKEEKAAMKALEKQMMQDSSESSSSSSESSDSDCEDVVMDMRTIPTDANGKDQMGAPKGELDTPIMVKETVERPNVANSSKCNPECSTGFTSSVCCSDKKIEEAKGLNALMCDPECSTSVSVGVGSSASVCCSSNKSNGPDAMVAEAAAPTDRIEVCMGGKCKKSGAMELMQEFERMVGTEGAVVGCKCMGKCRQGPNVRVRGMYGEGDESIKAVSNPLCIGVGLDDVGTIVANFFAEKKDMGFLAA